MKRLSRKFPVTALGSSDFSHTMGSNFPEMMIIEDAGTQAHLHNKKLQGTTHENLADHKSKGKSVACAQIQDESRISSGGKNKRPVRNDIIHMDLGKVPETTIKEQRKRGRKRKLAYHATGAATSQGQSEGNEKPSDCMTSKRRKGSYSRNKRPAHWNPMLCEKFRAALRRSAYYKEASTTQNQDGRTEPNSAHPQVVNHPQARKQVNQQSTPTSTAQRYTAASNNVCQTERGGKVLSTNFQATVDGAIIVANGAGAKAAAGPGSMTPAGPGVTATRASPGAKVTDIGSCVRTTATSAGSRTLDTSAGDSYNAVKKATGARAAAIGASAGILVTGADARTTASSTGAMTTSTSGCPKNPLNWIINAREKYKAITSRNSSVSTAAQSQFHAVNNTESISSMLHIESNVPDAGFVPSISEPSVVDLVAGATNSNPMPLNIEEERVRDQELFGSCQSSILQEENNEITLPDWDGHIPDEVSLLNEVMGFATSYVSANTNPPIPPLYWEEDMGMSSAYQGNDSPNHVPGQCSQERHVLSVTPPETTLYPTQAMGFSTPYASAYTNPPTPPLHCQEYMGMSSVYQGNDLLYHVPGPDSQERNCSSITPLEATQYATLNPVSSTGLLWTGQDLFAGADIGSSLQRVEMPTASVVPIYQPIYEGAVHGGSPFVREEILTTEYPWNEILEDGYLMPTEFSPMPQYDSAGTSGGCLVGREENSTTMAFQTPQISYPTDPSNSSMFTAGIQAGPPINPNALPTDWDNTLKESAVRKLHEGPEGSTYPNNESGSGIAAKQCNGFDAIGYSSSYLNDESSNLQDGIRFWDDNFIFDTDQLSTNLAWL